MHVPLVQAVVAALSSSGAGAREVSGLVEQAIPVLVDKLGDNNARLRESSRDALLSLARLKDAGLKSHCGLLVKPPKSQTAWRPVLSTLQLLQELVPLLGLAGGGGGGGFEVGELMDYIGKAFGNANAEVRGAAVKVAAVACMQGGAAVRKRLPKDINPKIKEQLDAVLGPEAPGESPCCVLGGRGIYRDALALLGHTLCS
jgi:centrosomal protein CEP104